jgi:hypothetical protein
MIFGLAVLAADVAWVIFAMDKLALPARVLFAVALIAYGADDFACAHFGLSVRGVPWFPANSFLGYLTGVVFVAAGFGIVANIRARTIATLLGILFLVLTLREIPPVIARPMSIGVRTIFFEALSMCAIALTMAATLPRESAAPRPWDGVVDNLLRAGPYLFAVSCIVFGIDHFLIIPFIASLVPAWIPAKMFWAYFTGAGFIAAGLSIATRKLDEQAGTWLGIMFLLWFVILHSPRVVNSFRIHNPGLPDEWSSAFIALAMCAGGWIVASRVHQRDLANDASERKHLLAAAPAGGALS